MRGLGVVLLDGGFVALVLGNSESPPEGALGDIVIKCVGSSLVYPKKRKAFPGTSVLVSITPASRQRSTNKSIDSRSAPDVLATGTYPLVSSQGWTKLSLGM